MERGDGRNDLVEKRSSGRGSALWLILTLALAMRLAVVFISEVRLNEDVDAYLAIGRNVAETGTFAPVPSQTPSAFRPPLYPLLIGPIAETSGWWVRGLLNVAAAVATIGILWRLAVRLSLDRTARNATVLFTATSPLAVWYCGYSMTEVLCGLLLTAAMTVLIKVDQARSEMHAASCGILFGLGSLCRPTSYVVAAGAVAWLVLRIARSNRIGQDTRRPATAAWLKRLRPVAILCIAAVLTVAPWAVRNWFQFGRPILATTHGGYTLLLGNNDAFYDEVVAAPWGTVWGNGQATWVTDLESEMAANGIEGELARDAYQKAKATQTIRNRPADFINASLQRITRLWNVVPQGPAAESLPRPVYYAVGLFYAATWLLAIAGIATACLSRKKPMIAVAIPVLAFTAVHTVYWSNARMRIPVEPFIFLFAGLGASAIWNLWRGEQPPVVGRSD